MLINGIYQFNINQKNKEKKTHWSDDTIATIKYIRPQEVDPVS